MAETTSRPRTLVELGQSPEFQNAAYGIKKEMFDNWVQNDATQILAPYPEQQRAAFLAQAQQMFNQAVPAPKSGGLSDIAGAYGAAAIETPAAVAQAISPENVVGTTLRSGADYIRTQWMSPEAQQLELEHQQRLAQDPSAWGQVKETVRDIAARPGQKLAGLAGMVTAPVVAAAAAPEAAAAAVGIGVATAAGIGDVRHLRAQEARAMPIEQLRQDPELDAMLKSGADETAVRDYAAVRVGVPELIAGATGAIPGGWVGRLAAARTGSSIVSNISRRLAGRGGAALEGAAAGSIGAGGQQAAMNIVQASYDPTKSWYDNVIAAGLEGGLAGTTLGGALHSNAATEQQLRARSVREVADNADTIRTTFNEAVAARMAEAPDTVDINAVLREAADKSLSEQARAAIDDTTLRTAFADDILAARADLLDSQSAALPAKPKGKKATAEVETRRKALDEERAKLRDELADTVEQDVADLVSLPENSARPVAELVQEAVQSLASDKLRGLVTPEVQAKIIGNTEQAIGLAPRIAAEALTQDAADAATSTPDLGTDTTAAGRAGEDTIPSGPDLAPPTRQAGAEAGVGPAIPAGGEGDGVGAQPVRPAEPVRQVGQGAPDANGGAPQPSGVEPTGLAGVRPEPGPAAPVPAGEPAAGPGAPVAAAPAAGAGVDGGAGAAGRRSTARQEPPRVTPDVAQAKNEQAVTRATTKGLAKERAEIGRRLDKEPADVQRAVLDAAAESGFKSPVDFTIAAKVDSTTSSPSFWTRLSDAVRGAVDRATKGLAIALAAIGIHHAVSVRDAVAAQRGGAYEVSRVMRAAPDEHVGAIASWVRAARDSDGKNYLIADARNNTLYTMSPEGRVLAETPSLFTRQPTIGDFLLTGERGNFPISRMTTPFGRAAQQVVGSGAERRINMGGINIPPELYNSVFDKFGGKLYTIADEATASMEPTALPDQLVAAVQEQAPMPAAPTEGSPLAAAAGLGAIAARRRRTGGAEAPTPVPNEPPAAAANRQAVTEARLRRLQRSATTPTAQAKIAAGTADTPSKVRGFAQWALSKVGGKFYNEARSTADLIDDAMGVKRQPRTEAARKWRDWTAQTFSDAQASMFDMFSQAGRDDVADAYRVGRSKYTNMMNVLDEHVKKVYADIGTVAKKNKTTTEQFARELDAEMNSKYAPGANKRRLEKAQADLEKARADLEDVRRNPTQEGARDKEEAALRLEHDATRTIKDFERWDNVVRTREQIEASDKDSARSFMNNITTAEAQLMQAELAKRPYFADLERIGGEFRKIQQDSVKDLVAAGRLSAEDLAKFTDDPYYFPSTGRDALEADGGPTGSSFRLNERERRGRGSKGDPAVTAILDQVKNHNRQIAFADFDRLITSAAWGDRDGVRVYDINNRLIPSGDRYEVRLADADGLTSRRYVVQFDDPNAMGALLRKNVKAVTLDALNTLAKYNSFFSFLVTRGVPAFAPVNAFKDIGERVGNIIAQSLAKDVNGARLAVDAYKNLPGMVLAARKNAKGADADLIRRMVDDGYMSTFTDFNKTDMGTQFRKMERTSGVRGIANKGIDAVMAYNEVFERGASAATLKAVMDQLQKQGMTAEDAYHAAGRATLKAMDFGQRGTVAPVMRLFYPFYGSRMVGATNVLRNLQTRKGQMLFAGQIVAGLLLYEMAKAVGGTDDELLGKRVDTISGAALQRAIPIFTGDSFVKIPVPYGMAFLGWNTGLAIARAMSGKWSTMDAAEHIFASFADELSPAGTPPPADVRQHPGWFALKMMTPEYMKRFINVVAGRNEFGADLNRGFLSAHEPRWMQGRQNTPAIWGGIAKVVSQTMGIDMTPEEAREMTATLIPQVQGIVDEMQRAGDTGSSAATPTALALLGIKGRLVSSVKSPLNNVFFDQVQDAQKLERQLVTRFGPIPSSADTGIRSINDRVALWLQSTDAPPEEARLIQALYLMESESKLRRGGQRVYDDETVRRSFLRRIQQQ